MIAFVVAYSTNRVIGINNQLPWHLPSDLKHFKHITSGQTVVMGRQTYESIGKPLPNRTNVVLTRNRDYQQSGAEIAHTKAEVLARPEDLYLIGGAQIFSQFLDVVDRMYITVVEQEVAGDTYFPEWDADSFTLIEQTKGIVDAQNAYPHTFYTYQRKHKNG